MNHIAVLRRTLIVLFVALSCACAGSTPTAPTPPRQSVILPAPAPPQTNFPPASGPSRTFTFDHTFGPTAADYTKQSRFVLYDDGAFVLQYLSLIGDYRGGYSESNGVITFGWEGWSVAGPWGATGTLQDGVLTVHYNLIMQLTDFEDAAYRLSP